VKKLLDRGGGTESPVLNVMPLLPAGLPEPSVDHADSAHVLKFEFRVGARYPEPPFMYV